MGTNQQEVRVRFSAEGIAEVVEAVKKINAEGKKAGHETSEAFKELNKQFEEVGRSLLGGLSIVYAADKLKELFKSTLEGAEGLTRLSNQTGLSTDAIQAFGQAARETGIGSEAANAGLAKLTLNIGRSATGSKQSQAALRDLNITAAQLSGLTADQRLQLIATRLSEIPDQGRRARDEMGLLGRGGVELDQAFVKLGEEGIGGFVGKMRELGTYLDTETIQQLLAAKDKLRDVSDIARGMGTQLIAGLVPALAEVAGNLAKATGGGEGFRKVGEFIGGVIRFLASGFQALGVDIGAFVADAVTLWNGFAEALSKIAHGKISDSIKAIKDAWRQAGEIDKAAAEDKARIEAEYEAGPPKPKPEETKKNEGGGTPPAPDEALARARYQFLTTMLDNELKLFQAKSKLEEDEAKGAYNRGELSLQDYYKRRADIINAESDKQIATLKAKLAAQEKLPLGSGVSDAAAQEQRRVEVEKLRGQIAEVNAQRQVALQQDQNALNTEAQRIADAQIKAAETLLQLAGKRTDAERVRLALEAQALDKQLAAGGVAQPDREAAVKQFIAQGTASIDLTDKQKAAQADLLKLETDKKRIQDQINSGELFSLQGEQRMLDLDRQRLPVLQKEADAQLKLARDTGDEQKIASAEAFKEKIDAIAASTNTAGQQMRELKAGIEQSVGAGLSTFLDDAIKKSHNLGQAFDAAAKQILADLVKIALQIEEQKLLKALFSGSLFGGGGGGGGGGLLSDVGLGGGGGALAAAGGGFVRGPGTTTSDSIPVLLSDKEFVVNAEATGRPGILGFLHALNEGAGAPRFRVPQLAGGGSVAAGLGSTTFVGAASRAGAPVQLHVAPEALHLTLRDWFERQVADINAKR